MNRTILTLSTVSAAAIAISLSLACNNDSTDTVCEREWQNRDEGLNEVEQLIDFEVLTPDYLPESTMAIPDVTTYPRDDEVELRFPTCNLSAPGILGPQVVIRESSHEFGLAEPGSSSPETELIEIEGTPVIAQKQESGTRVFVSMSWKQGGLSLWSTIDWESGDGEPAVLTADMEAEARRVVASIIRQSDGD